MKRINENSLAKAVTREEGKKVEMTIAQVKECLRVLFKILAQEHTASEVMELVERHG